MSYPISELDGITAEQVKLLKSVGIRTTTRFLNAAASAKGRKQLEAKTGIAAQQLLSWANMADRMRIRGIGEDNAKLLHAIGVVTVRELKYRNPEQLAQAMRELNGKRKLFRALPNKAAIKRWIEAAKKLDTKISY
jgi:predicted flap endonuclease-1-like 5' DNA nuclease